jgi:hypothetical protein
VFNEGLGFWQTLLALTMHLVPTFILVAALIVSWRWEWIGTVLFMICGLVFFGIVRGSEWVKAMFAVPCFAVAVLFLLNWLKRTELHSEA